MCSTISWRPAKPAGAVIQALHCLVTGVSPSLLQLGSHERLQSLEQSHRRR